MTDIDDSLQVVYRDYSKVIEDQYSGESFLFVDMLQYIEDQCKIRRVQDD